MLRTELWYASDALTSTATVRPAASNSLAVTSGMLEAADAGGTTDETTWPSASYPVSDDGMSVSPLAGLTVTSDTMALSTRIRPVPAASRRTAASTEAVRSEDPETAHVRVYVCQAPSPVKSTGVATFVDPAASYPNRAEPDRPTSASTDTLSW